MQLRMLSCPNFAMGALLFLFAPVSAASILEELPHEIAQEDNTDCAGKSGEYIDISIQCYYEKLQYEILRNQKIRDLISKGFERQSASEVAETPDIEKHFEEAHGNWKKFGEMTCVTLVAESTGYISKYLTAEQNACWLKLYLSYSKILLTMYGPIVLSESKP